MPVGISDHAGRKARLSIRQENSVLGRLLAISANSAWNLLNFRRGLLKHLMDQGYSLSALIPAGDGVSKLERMGIVIRPIPINPRSLSPISDLGLLLSYRKHFEELHPAAFLSFTAKPNIYGSIAARWSGVPVVANITGLGTGFLSGKVLEFIQSKLYRLALVDAQKVFFHNPDDRKLFVDRRITDLNRSEVIPGSGVDLYHFEGLPPAHNSNLIFLFIGRFLKDKGFREFVEAARLVKCEHPGIRLQALGTIELHPKSITLEVLQQWKKERVIELLGTTDDVRPFIAQADCVVLPSYREGLPRALLEASAMGRPVIATDVPGCREVVEEGVSGFLCRARSASSLAEAMMKFASLSPRDRQAMGIQARRKASDEFGESRVIEAYLSALRRIFADASRNAREMLT